MTIRDRIRSFRRKPPPISCQELVELVTAYLEGTLAPAEHARLDAHLSACEACTMYLDQLRDTIAIMGALEPEQLSPAAEQELGAVFATWKAEREG